MTCSARPVDQWVNWPISPDEIAASAAAAAAAAHAADLDELKRELAALKASISEKVETEVGLRLGEAKVPSERSSDEAPPRQR